MSRLELPLTGPQKLGKLLRKARLAACFTQKELAATLGVLTPYIQDVERGVRDDVPPMVVWRWRQACGEYTPPPEELRPAAPLPPLPNSVRALLALVPPHKLKLPPHGSILRELRRQAGLTQVQLAVQLGCTASYVCQVERGKCGLTVGVARYWMACCGHILPPS